MKNKTLNCYKII